MISLWDMSVYRAINVWKFSNKLRALFRLLLILFSLPSNPPYINRWRCALWQLSWISCANFPMKSFPPAKPNAPFTSSTRDACYSHLFKCIDWTSSHVIRRTLINLRNSVIQLEHMTWRMMGWSYTFRIAFCYLFANVSCIDRCIGSFSFIALCPSRMRDESVNVAVNSIKKMLNGTQSVIVHIFDALKTHDMNELEKFCNNFQHFHSFGASEIANYY